MSSIDKNYGKDDVISHISNLNTREDLKNFIKNEGLQDEPEISTKFNLIKRNMNNAQKKLQIDLFKDYLIDYYNDKRNDKINKIKQSIKDNEAKDKLIKFIDENNNISPDFYDDYKHPSHSNKNIIKKSLNEKLPEIIASNKAVPSKGIFTTAIDIGKWQEKKHEMMKEKERELKQRMEKLADKIGKMHTYSTIGKMKIIQKYHPFYNELMDIEKHIHNIDKQEKRIQELEEKMENISVDKSKNQEIIKSYEKGNSILKKNISVLEQKIAHLEEKINHSPTTSDIMKRRTRGRRTIPSSRRTRSSKNLSPNERKILARHGIRDNKVYPYPLMSNDTSKKWVKNDPLLKRSSIMIPNTNTKKAGKRTQKKHRKSRKL